MRVLVACECTGAVRDAFLAAGADAWSCDLKPTESPGPHIQGDVRKVLRWGWDLMIAHPECTKLTVAAAWCMYHPDDRDLPADQRRPHPRYPDRQAEQDEAAAFFMEMAAAPIPYIAIENPVGVMSSRYRKPDQIVQPYEFGHDASKKTCLWLKGLPRLSIDPAARCSARKVIDPKTGKMAERWANQTDSGQNRLGPSGSRSADRAATYTNIAAAMARDWMPAVAGQFRLAA